MDPLLQDISDQPRALRAALAATTAAPALQAARAALGRASHLVLSGMGASYFAAYPAFLRLLGAGRPVAWVEAGELVHFAPEALGPGGAVVLVSQSGRSAEIVRLLAERRGAVVVGVTNDPDSPLGRGADICLAMGAGPEAAGVATKTLACTMLILDLLAGGAAADGSAVAGAVEALVAARDGWLPELRGALGEPEHVWVLGRGPGLAAALAAGLMLKEAGAVHAEGMSAPQFRHGPLEAAGAGRSALVFVTPGAVGAHDVQLAGEMAAAGMRVAALCPGAVPAEVPAGVSTLAWPSAHPAALLVGPELLAHAYAARRGVVPGTFVRVAKVTTRE